MGAHEKSGLPCGLLGKGQARVLQLGLSALPWTLRYTKRLRSTPLRHTAAALQGLPGLRQSLGKQAERGHDRPDLLPRAHPRLIAPLPLPAQACRNTAILLIRTQKTASHAE